LESNRLFVSKDESKIINIYTDVSIFEKNDTTLTMKSRFCKLKNPDKVCISPNGEFMAVKNNNGLIEVYNLDSENTIFKGKGPRTFGGNMFFLDDVTLLSSTEEGTIYILDILTGNINYCSCDMDLNYVELVEITSTKYFVLGNNKSNGDTSIYSLSFNERIAEIKLLYISSAKLNTGAARFINDKLYVVSEDNEMFAYNYDIKSNLLISEKKIKILEQPDVIEFTEHAFDTIHQIISDVGIDLSPSLFPIGITATIKDKYIVIAFNLGLAVVDIDDWKCVTKIPLKYGISSVLVTDNGKYMWFGSSKGIQCFFIKDVIKGIISEKSIY